MDKQYSDKDSLWDYIKPVAFAHLKSWPRELRRSHSLKRHISFCIQRIYHNNIISPSCGTYQHNFGQILLTLKVICAWCMECLKRKEELLPWLPLRNNHPPQQPLRRHDILETGVCLTTAVALEVVVDVMLSGMARVGVLLLMFSIWCTWLVVVLLVCPLGFPKRQTNALWSSSTSCCLVNIFLLWKGIYVPNTLDQFWNGPTSMLLTTTVQFLDLLERKWWLVGKWSATVPLLFSSWIFLKGSSNWKMKYNCTLLGLCGQGLIGIIILWFIEPCSPPVSTVFKWQNSVANLQ